MRQNGARKSEAPGRSSILKVTFPRPMFLTKDNVTGAVRTPPSAGTAAPMAGMLEMRPNADRRPMTAATTSRTVPALARHARRAANASVPAKSPGTGKKSAQCVVEVRPTRRGDDTDHNRQAATTVGTKSGVSKTGVTNESGAPCRVARRDATATTPARPSPSATAAVTVGTKSAAAGRCGC